MNYRILLLDSTGSADVGWTGAWEWDEYGFEIAGRTADPVDAVSALSRGDFDAVLCLSWSFEEVDAQLKKIMENVYHNIDNAAKKYGFEGNYVVGANIAGFVKVLDAMNAQGIVSCVPQDMICCRWQHFRCSIRKCRSRPQRSHRFRTSKTSANTHTMMQLGTKPTRHWEYPTYTAILPSHAGEHCLCLLFFQ